MAAKGGKEHHNVVALREAKAKVLDFVRQGLELTDAIDFSSSLSSSLIAE